jgi:O-methyltransferase involved in polyketide biosynthesis
LADSQVRAQIFERINSMGNVALVITEGLMVYLKPEQVSQFAQDVARQHHVRYWILDIVAPFIVKMMRRTWGRQLHRAPFLFAPEEGAGFYERFGWRLVSYRSTWRESQRYKREPATAWVWRILFPRAWRAEENKRSGPMTGVLMLERMT